MELFFILAAVAILICTPREWLIGAMATIGVVLFPIVWLAYKVRQTWGFLPVWFQALVLIAIMVAVCK